MNTVSKGSRAPLLPWLSAPLGTTRAVSADTKWILEAKTPQPTISKFSPYSEQGFIAYAQKNGMDGKWDQHRLHAIRRMPKVHPQIVETAAMGMELTTWKRLSMPDRIVHTLDSINEILVWKVASDDLPQLYELLEAVSAHFLSEQAKKGVSFVSCLNNLLNFFYYRYSEAYGDREFDILYDEIASFYTVYFWRHTTETDRRKYRQLSARAMDVTRQYYSHLEDMLESLSGTSPVTQQVLTKYIQGPIRRVLTNSIMISLMQVAQDEYFASEREEHGDERYWKEIISDCSVRYLTRPHEGQRVIRVDGFLKDSSGRTLDAVIYTECGLAEKLTDDPEDAKIFMFLMSPDQHEAFFADGAVPAYTTFLFPYTSNLGSNAIALCEVGVEGREVSCSVDQYAIGGINYSILQARALACVVQAIDPRYILAEGGESRTISKIRPADTTPPKESEPREGSPQDTPTPQVIHLRLGEGRYRTIDILQTPSVSRSRTSKIQQVFRHVPEATRLLIEGTWAAWLPSREKYDEARAKRYKLYFKIYKRPSAGTIHIDPQDISQITINQFLEYDQFMEFGQRIRARYAAKGYVVRFETLVKEHDRGKKETVDTDAP